MLCVVASQALQHNNLRRTRLFSDFFNTLLDKSRCATLIARMTEKRKEIQPVDDNQSHGHHRSVKVREAIKLIEEDGWYLARTRGSHRHFKHPQKPGLVTIAGHPGVDIPRGTLNSILKQAGLKN